MGARDLRVLTDTAVTNRTITETDLARARAIQTPADMSAHFAAFCAANPTEGRRIFESAIAQSATPAEADDRRLLCEYFCNPEFKRGMHEHVAKLNGL